MKKVLLIEDDRILRENTAELLELSDYEVITASQGKIGVEMAKLHFPDIIVCDIMMPELDGYGVLETLSKKKAQSLFLLSFYRPKQNAKILEKGWI